MVKKWSNFELGQRVEARDAVQLAVDTPVQSVQTIARDLFMGQDEPVQNAVLRGFTVANPSGTTIEVSGGTAVLGFRREGATRFGMVSSEGSDLKSTDLVSLSDGVYGVYIRFEFADTDFANRFFWNPLATTPVDTPRNVATRLSEDWTFVVDLVSPGPEWLLVNSVTKVGAVLTLQDQRKLLLDTPSGTIASSDWGTSQDRVEPVESLRQMCLALARQIQDITGNPDWRGFTPTSITQLLVDVIRTSGVNSFLSGATLNWIDDTGVIGNVFPVDRIVARQFDGANEFEDNVGSERALLQGGYLDDQQAGPERVLLMKFAGFYDIGGGVYQTGSSEVIRVYAAGDGLGGSHTDALEIAVNCAWDPATGEWRRDRATDGDSASRSLLVAFGGPGVFSAYARDVTLAATWSDAVSATTGWNQLFLFSETGVMNVLGLYQYLGGGKARTRSLNAFEALAGTFTGNPTTGWAASAVSATVTTVVATLGLYFGLDGLLKPGSIVTGGRIYWSLGNGSTSITVRRTNKTTGITDYFNLGTSESFAGPLSFLTESTLTFDAAAGIRTIDNAYSYMLSVFTEVGQDSTVVLKVELDYLEFEAGG